MRFKTRLLLVLLLGTCFLAEARVYRLPGHRSYSRQLPEVTEEPADPDTVAVPSPEAVWKAVCDSADTTGNFGPNPLLMPNILVGLQRRVRNVSFIPKPYDFLKPTPKKEPIPFARKVAANRDIRQMRQLYLISNPDKVEFANWQLKRAKPLPPENFDFEDYVLSLHLPGVSFDRARLPKAKYDKIRWLHVFNGDVQLSQAYLSKNWYQGGNNYLSFLFNVGWSVTLNRVYSPNLLFENSINYKLGLNSVQNDPYHDYSISEDRFQWNMKAGFKAWTRWFYTLTAQFKTQFLNNYAPESDVRSASFLSPGDLNIGVGMTYSLANKKKTVNLSLSISPLSYNLKTCIDPDIDPTQFNIKIGHKVHNELGSSSDIVFTWAITTDINLKSRLFAFTDFKNYTQDWENTLSFSINRFLSTQVYVNLRYDSSSPTIEGSRWHHWMLKEILSFGFTYHFQTAPSK